MGHPLCWSLFLFSISFSPYNKVGAIFISQAKKKTSLSEIKWLAQSHAFSNYQNKSLCLTHFDPITAPPPFKMGIHR